MRLVFVLAACATLGALTTAPSASAAESYDSCAGFITSLPATITTQGVWCLKGDLSTAITTGAAIQVNTNNVTIDCNGFKLGGLQGGPTSQADGISATGRLNTRVRSCHIRGFHYGVYLAGGGGHLVEDNRFDGSLASGVRFDTSSGAIRHNQILDSGAVSFLGISAGLLINGSVDVIDNTIAGVAPLSGDTHAMGIYTVENLDGQIAGNRIRGLVPFGTGSAIGIFNLNGSMQMRDNALVGPSTPGSTGIFCGNANGSAVMNQISGFATGIFECHDEMNFVNPIPV